jgi:hypothetical protein
MSTPIWPATIAADHTHRTLVRDWLTGTLAGQFQVDDVVVDTHGDGALTDIDLHVGDVVVRFTRIADLPEQHLAAIGHRDPGPYGRVTWTNADDTDLGAAVLRGDRHRDPRLVGEALRAAVFEQLEAVIATHHLDDRILRPEPEEMDQELPVELQPDVLGVRRRGENLVVVTDFAGLRVDVHRTVGDGEVIYEYTNGPDVLTVEQIGVIAAGGRPDDPPFAGSAELGELTAAHLDRLADTAAATRTPTRSGSGMAPVIAPPETSRPPGRDL